LSKSIYGNNRFFDLHCVEIRKDLFFCISSSPHAEMMRKRNNIIFNLVESEREYVHQLEILVANYVRPFRMGKN
jgi:hypothetical protein